MSPIDSTLEFPGLVIQQVVRPQEYPLDPGQTSARVLYWYPSQSAHQGHAPAHAQARMG